MQSNGGPHAVAVKILRPGIEKRFERDLESFYFAARAAERFSPQSRRLRPVAAVDTLAQSVLLEMDLRLEAAAISEMAENIAKARGSRFPRSEGRLGADGKARPDAWNGSTASR